MIFVTVQDNVAILQFSERVMNYLKRCGIHTVGEFMEASPEELREKYNVGAGSVRQIRKRQEEIRDLTGDFALRMDPAEKSVPETEEEQLQKELNAIKKKHPLIRGELYLFMAYDIPVLRRRIKTRVLDGIAANGGEMMCETVAGYFPDDIRGTVIQEEILLELKQAGLIRERNGILESMDLTLREWIEEQEDDRMKEVLTMRFGGRTQNEIAEHFGITHQRVNAMIREAMKYRPALREDRYIYLVENYKLTCEVFVRCFGEDEEAYYYVKQCAERGKERKVLKLALEDDKVPESLKKKLRQVG